MSTPRRTRMLGVMLLGAMFFTTSVALAEARMRIFSQLSVGQVRETIRVTVGGITQTLQLDERTPRGYVEFHGRHPGDYHAVFASLTSYYHQGKLVAVPGYGTGIIHAGARADFALTLDLRTTPATIGLQALP